MARGSALAPEYDQTAFSLIVFRIFQLVSWSNSVPLLFQAILSQNLGQLHLGSS